MIKQILSITFLLLIFSSYSYGQNRWKDFDFDEYNAETTTEIPPQCLNETPILTNKSLGPFEPGQTLREVETTCDSLLYDWNLGTEAIESPYAAVLIGNTRVHFEMSSTSAMSRVIYIRVLGSGIKTEEGFGISTKIVDVIDEWGEPSFGHNECQLYVWFDSHPGISFALNTPSGFGCMEMSKIEQSGNVDLLPKNSVIYSIHLYEKE